ncbi:MAG TPA: TlpA disulfide reductase family protein [Acidimicrobiia bacterium]|nr:TlpA disulfide reductase family protein [Acidimicrobiia bacterium]
MSPRLVAVVVVVALLGTACASAPGDGEPAGDLAPIDVAQFVDRLETSSRPLVVNLWASWCIPCRSEAPLLRQAHARFGDSVDFLGIATEDQPGQSVAFIDEFALQFENREDRSGSVKGHLGAIGLPVTIFVLPGGEILRTHFGVIDDAALALGIDDLLAS